MLRDRGAACLLFLALLTFVQGVHEPPPGAPAFLRSAVESVPDDSSAKFEPLKTFEFGETKLPLRSAVESIPSVSYTESSQKTFIRSSVEARPANFDDELETSASNIKPTYRQTLTGQYDAYILPKSWDFSYDTYQPPPFRSGSPFQRIVDSKIGFQRYMAGIESFNKLRDAEAETKKVLCYITNWSFYRQKEGRFIPELLDTKLCTHIIYSFGSLNPSSLTLKEFDKWADIDNDLYRRTTSLSGDVPVLLAIGGWTDSTGDKYSRLVSDASARRHFIQSVVPFLKQYGFKGVHFEWNYPKCWQSDCRKGPDSDRPNFTRFIQELSIALRRESLLLGVGVSGYKEVIVKAYDMAELSDAADFITVMSYDYHGAWEGRTGHISPLYGQSDDKYPQYNTDYTVKLLVKRGARRSKLIVGVPFYGQSFTLREASQHSAGYGTESRGPGRPGEITKQPGMLAYYEICENIRNKRWEATRVKAGPYASKGDQWVGYEDTESVALKAKYVVDTELGGIAAWTVDLDDFNNKCCFEAFPLLSSINRVFKRISSPKPLAGDCRKPPAPVTPIAPVMTTVGENGIGPGVHEPTTWPSWKPGQSTTQSSTESTSSSTAWWQTSPAESSTWWPTTTTKRSTTTRWSTTTRRPTTTTVDPDEEDTVEITAIPTPVNFGPVTTGETCVDGEYRADPASCSSYYYCVYGELRQQHCAAGLHWNVRGTRCDWPYNARCFIVESDEVPETSTIHKKPTPTTTTTTTTEVPSTTERRTTARKTTTTTTTEVPFTTERRTTTRKTTTATRATTHAPSTRPPRPMNLSACQNGVYYPNLNDCGSYYICNNNVLVPNQCGPGLQWDQANEQCELTSKVRCISSKSYFAYARLAELQLDDPCDEGNDYVPYPGDCERYLICLYGNLKEQNCAPGLHWNKEDKVCDWPAHANCQQTSGGGSAGGGLSEVDDLNEVKPPKPKPTTTTTTTTTRKPRPVTPRPDIKPLSGHFKLVCYFTNWAWYRQNRVAKYTPDNIDTRLCTHIVYGFAVLDVTALTIRTHDSWADIDNKFYTRVTDLKHKGVNVSLALGGWNDSQGDKYSRLVLNPESRRKFIEHALQFLLKYNFDGLDLDWEYPKCWQTDCKKGQDGEKEAFTALVRELSAAFKPHGLLLSTAVSPSKQIIDAGYDVPELSKYFDWIAVMTYDFHGQWDKKTGHVAPLYYHPDDDVPHFNANFSLNYWIEKGAPRRKIVMGMPLYGQAFSLTDVNKHGLNAHAPQPGQAGEFTRAAGFLAYYEICDRIVNKGWTVVQDPEHRMGPYAYKGNQWVSFDDKAMLRQKSQLVRKMGLGGGMIWALDLDDFTDRCGEGVHPLLTEIQSVLRDPPNESDLIESPTPTSTATATSSESNTQGSSSSVDPASTAENYDTVEIEADAESAPASALNTDFKVVCYFTNWAWYRQGKGKYLPEEIDADLCTHIVYGFAVLDRESLTIKPHDTWADFDNHFYERVTAYKKKGVKVTVAIGGWNDSAGDKYSRLVRNAAARKRFIENVIRFIEKHNFDGLDLDWEYPVCWQVDCRLGHPDEKEHFAEFVRELADAFRPYGWLLSSAVSPSKTVIDAGYDVKKLAQYFDWIAVMAYDYHGQWDKQTGHVAPMYSHPTDTSPYFNTNYTINYWIDQGADSRKLVLGMPMYGQSFSLAETHHHGLNQPSYGGGEAGEDTRARGFLAYYEICQRIRQNKWTVVRDRRGRMGPYAYSKDQWVSFDDQLMIRHKSEFVKAMNLGGAMIWALDLDDFSNLCDCEEYPLLRTINRVLRNYPGPGPVCVLEDAATVSSAEDEVATTTSAPTSMTWWPTQPPSTTPKRPSSTTKKPLSTTKGPATTTFTQPPPEIEDEDEEPGSSIEPDAANVCTTRSQSFYPHGSDCNKYYQCDNGHALLQSCPPTLYWNQDHCDWPSNTNCKSSGGSAGTENTVEGQQQPSNPTSTTTLRPTTEGPTREPRPTLPPDAVEETDNGEFKVVCYFTNWAWYRPEGGKFFPKDIDPNLCTHIVYGFATLNGETLTIQSHDTWADIDNHFYEQVTDFKKQGKKVLIAIGGWNDSAGDKYSRLVRSATNRERFITNVIEYIKKYNFDGLDLDWEYPKCWQVECDRGRPDEKEMFGIFVKELYDEFYPRGWLLTAAVSPSKMVIDAGYDIPVLAKYLSWIAVMAYDYHGQWDRKTGHVAPLYARPDDQYSYFNSNFTINYWIEKGAPSRKIVMGVPLYGQSFVLSSPSNNGLNAPSYGGGDAGRYTRASGFLAFYEICVKTNTDGWSVTRDPQGRIGPYATKGNQWVSYDDVADIRRKAKYMKEMNLGGGMVWAIDLDDFTDTCGCGHSPLLTTLNQELRNIGGPRRDDCT